MEKPRLIVAADFDPAKCGWIAGVLTNVMLLARNLKGLPLQLKLNSALRAGGLNFAAQLHLGGAEKIFADYKLVDIDATLQIDGNFLAGSDASIGSVTVMCNANVAAMKALCAAVQPHGIRVIGVTVPTSWSEDECGAVYGCSMAEAVKRLALLGAEANLDGIVASGQELQSLRETPKLAQMSFEIPGIRPLWYLNPDDDQKRVVTPAQAVQWKASAIIVGRPITGAKPNSDGKPQSPREAAEWILKEIDDAYALQH